MRLLISESQDFDGASLATLRQHFDVVALDIECRDELLTQVEKADLLWVRLRHRLDKELLDAAPKLQAIITATTGLTHIDMAAMQSRHVAVLSLRGETEFLNRICATAEHTVGLLLALFRQLPAAFSSVQAGDWQRMPFRGQELQGKTVGIVGYGRLGRLVAGYLRAFGMSVVVSDRRALPACDVSIDGAPEYQALPLPELLAVADVVSIHVDLNDSSQQLLGKTEFAAMKDGAVLLNTARGEVIDEVALLAALESGRLAGAALDVLANEKESGMSDNALVCYAKTHKNLILTPHIGGATWESMAKTEAFMTAKLLGWQQTSVL